jgi:hypothetical protein
VSREVDVEIVDRAGRPVGRVPTFKVGEPWWQDVTEIVGEVRRRFAVDIAVLRLLRAGRAAPPGGPVTYLAEVADGTGGVDSLLAPTWSPSPDDPRRLPYARPGGPASTVRWATAALRERGISLLRPRQFRTWNLSSIWRLTTSVGELWLKEVPPFLAGESTLTTCLGTEFDGLAPSTICAAGTRLILRHVDGVDCYGASVVRRAEVARVVHRIHIGSVGLLDRLLDGGLPDRRGERAVAGLADLSALVPVVRRHAARLRESALQRVERAERDGAPPVLLHGDLHCGNVRSTAAGLVLLDWSNACVGHPAFDIIRLTEGLSLEAAGQVVREWARLWRGSVGFREMVRSVELLRPVHFLMRAIVCAGYLLNFEESEHKYHRHNLDNYLRLLLSP